MRNHEQTIAQALAEAKQILAKIKRGESRWISSDEVMQAVLTKRADRLAKEQEGKLSGVQNSFHTFSI